MQVVQAEAGSRSGLRINHGSVSPIQLIHVDEGANYTDVLPSLNLYYDIDRHNRIRFAAAKVMARPRMDDMRANLVPGFNGDVCSSMPQPALRAGREVHPWSAAGGNPKLEPWRAKEVDIGYEWYGGKASYFAIHGFYMWLDNYIYTQAIPADFTGFTPPAAELAKIPAERRCTISPIGVVDRASQRQGRLDPRSRGERRVRVRPARALPRRLRRDRQCLLHRLQAEARRADVVDTRSFPASRNGSTI